MLTGMQSVNYLEVCIINEPQNINKHISEESPTSPHTDQMLFFGWVFFFGYTSTLYVQVPQRYKFPIYSLKLQCVQDKSI